MAGTATHIAIADKINSILGDGAIKNLPLFFGGNLAPDAIHAKKDYKRADKKHSHLCDGIRSYGYGYSEIAKLFKDRVNEFIEKYYMTAGEDKDLYFGYIVHLLADEFYLLSVYKRLENHLKNNGANPDEPGFRKNLADEVNNGGHKEFFSDTSYIIDISAHEYDFKQNVVDVLEAAWDYEVKDYIGANEINISKRWVIDNFFKSEKTKSNDDHEMAANFVELAANDAIARLSCKDGIIKLLR
jgi:hypothetical protein